MFFLIYNSGGWSLNDRSCVTKKVDKHLFVEHLFASRRNAPGCVGRRGAGAANSGAEFFSPPKKKDLPLFYYTTTRQGLVKHINKNFFIKFFQNFSLSSLEIKIFLWYNRRGEFARTFVRANPQPPNLYYTI